MHAAWLGTRPFGGGQYPIKIKLRIHTNGGSEGLEGDEENEVHQSLEPRLVKEVEHTLKTSYRQWLGLR